ncbi:MAG: hypothetical protein GKR87_13180 [Kiritimatiellae bacterium]|nr:hypothetical protein [Kiritimatiellia bacterium]NKB25302.1 hypothetical protein [Kiritimatiellia bacterium]
MQLNDPAIEAVRKIRHKISATDGHDIRKPGKHYKKYQEQLKATGEYRFRVGRG